MHFSELGREFIIECRCKQYSEKTVSLYEKAINYLREHLRENYHIFNVEDIKPTHIKQFMLLKQEQGCKAGYINNLLKVYKVMFGYGLEESYIDENPAKKIKNVKQPKEVIRTFNKKDIKAMECML